MPRNQTLRQPTPGPSGTRWSEDLFPIKQETFPYLILTFTSSELTSTPFLEPSQHNEPPIPGPIQASAPHEDHLTPCPATPTSIIIVPLHLPLQSSSTIFPSTPTPEIPPIAPKSPTTSSPQSHDEAWQEFRDLLPTLMIPRAIVHKSINQLLLEHCHFLHMIPFVDAAHHNEMHQEFREEINSLLGQELEAYPKEDITRIGSKYLAK
ncbi:hypothetical protein O181_040529 [Austropuccinia psidii MF-1]|uniref:Uncharacterized protein n=1 Tax=Austropuccinia psidii MF-1 TaxID=1389203 RepID=A0A9Q3HFL8_9BASI|nr:hypothetical protein [Austropuccinia psidii MF-1]